MVEGTGFEPVYAMRSDLQSDAFNHSATPPKQGISHQKCWPLEAAIWTFISRCQCNFSTIWYPFLESC